MIFRRFAAVGILSTTVDVGILCALRLGAGIPVIFADAVSITAAAAVSYSLHRAVTFADDPHVRWVREGTTFAWVTLVAGALDVGLCRSGVAVFGAGAPALLAAKAIALAGADHVLVQPQNRGKGAAVRAGVLAARGRTVAFTDADLSYPPAQLVHLLEEVEAGWDVVVGSRKHIETTELVKAARLRALTGRLFNSITLAVLLGQYRDTQCGLKAFRSDVARLLFSMSRLDGFAFDVELFHLVERYHLSLLEVPVSLANSSTSTVRVGIDAARMIRDLFRVRRWAGSGVYELDEEQRKALTAPR